MRSTKLRWKVMAGILCAAMVFQSVPVQTVASEVSETTETYDSGELAAAEDETQQDETGTDAVSAVSEDAGENLTDDSVEEPESLDMTETSREEQTIESPSETENSDIQAKPSRQRLRT